jgi:uncharacterized OsmC-like protein
MSNKTLKFSVRSVSKSPASAEVSTRGFKLFVDEPVALGGTDQAPNPVEYVLAGYAGCVNVVAHLIAKEQGVELPNLQIDIEGELNPNRLFGKSNDDRAGYRSINVQLTTSAPITDDVKQKLLAEIEHRCPVNDNLSNPTPIQFLLN